MRKQPNRQTGPHYEEFLKLTPDERDAWLGFLRAYAVIVKELDAELEREHRLSLSAYDVLVQLSLRGPIRMSELADAVLISRAGMTRLVERLERDGLVERRTGAKDARQVLAHITERGLELLASCAPTHFAGVRERFLDPLSETQKRHLARAWRQLLGERGCGVLGDAGAGRGQNPPERSQR